MEEGGGSAGPWANEPAQVQAAANIANVGVAGGNTMAEHKEAKAKVCARARAASPSRVCMCMPRVRRVPSRVCMCTPRARRA